MTTNKIILEDDDIVQQPPKKPEIKQKEVGDGNVIDLPSGGALGYPGQIRYRDILVRDEEILAGTTIKTYQRTINSVLSGITNDEEWFTDMCVHDRDYVLVWVWANNYSSTKETEEECPECGEKHVYTVDLTKQPTIEINPKFKGSSEIELKCGTTISIALNTVSDEIEAERYMTKNPDSRFEYLMLCLQLDTGVQMTLEQKMDWIQNNITGREMSKIRQFHKLFRFGLDPMVNYTCKGCGGEFQSEFPFRPEDIITPQLQASVDDFL